MKDESKWLLSAAQIVYTAIVGFVMLMACLEWLLWFAAFVYCFIKAYIKAEHWSIRVLCLFVGSAFALLRYVSLAMAGDKLIRTESPADHFWSNVDVVSSASYSFPLCSLLFPCLGPCQAFGQNPCRRFCSGLLSGALQYY